MKKPVVIVGSGLAGVTVARELRKLDADKPVVIVSADDGGFYSKPSLSNALAAGKSPAQLLLTPRETLAMQLKAEIRPHARVTQLLPAERAIEIAGGRTPRLAPAGRIEYEQLVLALGAQPIRLPIEGDGAAGVLAVNNLADYAAFRARLEGKRRVAILGAGLIGCEFANDLRLAGFAVDVFDIAPQPLGRLLPPVTAAFFRQKLAAAGVCFHFVAGVVRIERDGETFRLTDNGGGGHAADIVLSAVGLKPETALARAAGLAVNRGIVTARSLATSDPRIFALGDCAEIEGMVLPFVMPIMAAARALAKTLAGTPTDVAYPAMPVVVKTPACPTAVCPPPAGSAGAWREEATADGVKALFEDAAGRPLGFALAGSPAAERQALGEQMPAWL
ncbi:MAG: FAD-dependent oxidoreductase [Sulfurisoma sp.]|nr:FAD-dependent oxidoreductase [Sulfurisoma sp.]